jgi:hypothetical protein
MPTLSCVDDLTRAGFGRVYLRKPGVEDEASA